jgi:O-antigen ligase
MTDSKQPSVGSWMGSMWLYTVLRFGMFFLLWWLVVLAGLGGFVAAIVALVLSVPLSLVLLAAPRARFAANIEARMNAHREAQAELDEQLSGNDDEDA